ncbi:hypothetical protein [Pseudomonas sp. 24 R 17]|uniref:Uncharacterized protein n=1 Tax=Pseudomonas tritici TaxID=2745518 RepID=A0A8H9YRN1_9PSED|nr:hypothetical protein [Pseudomonas sp. 24 R 17]
MQQLRVLLAIQGGISTFERLGAFFYIAPAYSPAAVHEGDGNETSNSRSNGCSGDLPAFGGSAFLLSGV